MLEASMFISTRMKKWSEDHLPLGDMGQRLGQYLMNSLFDVRDDLFESILGTEADPFYTDARLGAFLAFLTENWDKK